MLFKNKSREELLAIREKLINRMEDYKDRIFAIDVTERARKLYAKEFFNLMKEIYKVHKALNKQHLKELTKLENDLKKKIKQNLEKEA